MAGRGTDIQLGGNVEMRIGQELAAVTDEPSAQTRNRADPREVADNKQKALAAGGLYMIGTERHESRRIDNQLRGRSGRQGDPGASKFFLSLQDDLMRIFGSERMDAILTRWAWSRARPSPIPGSTRPWKRRSRKSKPATSRSARTS